ncbi:Gfo/Idh/MocA family oxidoreductase [Marinobacter halodurans]|uniref:Gfo/Idh/MocA family oxidoreductase n=1 Tax=Marinobacter halodurans TaxID=2528979 RepID=A0ABY1ZKE7_9GAMM|nr:Gfo/Idh/MocA family oxidoreductase [Marinobacter halodurans]TBW55997.1 Gfo/Idh/MocA family oxidoreductase [Marinobacter halodurans]
MSAIRIGIVGFGKIARDQHLPALNDNPAYELVAVASPSRVPDSLPHYTSMTAMLDAVPEMDAVALCVPPAVRYGLASEALARGCHVLLEKPPGATLAEVGELERQARVADRTLFASWHSRHAPAVAPAREWLKSRRIIGVDIEWKEDVCVWHPGQDWIWEPGGMGVFDPGINALSIATAILDEPFFFREGVLAVPDNRQAPIAADLGFASAAGYPVNAAFDFRQQGPQIWDIHIETDGGKLTLSKGGSQLLVDGELQLEAPEQEYPGLYQRFAELIGRGEHDVDASPLRHVADAFLLGRRVIVDPFHWQRD